MILKDGRHYGVAVWPDELPIQEKSLHTTTVVARNTRGIVDSW